MSSARFHLLLPNFFMIKCFFFSLKYCPFQKQAKLNVPGQRWENGAAAAQLQFWDSGTPATRSRRGQSDKYRRHSKLPCAPRTWLCSQDCPCVPGECSPGPGDTGPTEPEAVPGRSPSPSNCSHSGWLVWGRLTPSPLLLNCPPTAARQRRSS